MSKRLLQQSKTPKAKFKKENLKAPDEPELLHKIKKHTELYWQTKSLVEEAERSLESKNEFIKTSQMEDQFIQMLKPFHRRMTELNDKVKEQSV